MTSARRGEGGSRTTQFCGRIRLIGCVKCGQGGGGGLKSQKFCGRHMYMAPCREVQRLTQLEIFFCEVRARANLAAIKVTTNLEIDLGYGTPTNQQCLSIFRFIQI